ncbi:MAG: HipA N-terminal domain-containing protein [Bacteroidota bacterium]|jgi:serine/threonine-protein kinase HipA|nr:HipA N-terminal domain-containing protein [Cytophagales bacterium]MCE2955833.1 HipA N-terminal domain-containing protein [Flammeovirgaceae bacterium]MCZ8069496.1 HipA N-terminal domain-containing protein [Cytophagales bacterium]
MRKAQVFFDGELAGYLVETDWKSFQFEYVEGYSGSSVSLTMPVSKKRFEFETFPPFFDGLLPEGQQLEGLLRQNKIDRGDNFSQLLAVGADLVGAVSVKPLHE